jgi:hypothetical protein
MGTWGFAAVSSPESQDMDRNFTVERDIVAGPETDSA